MPHKYTPTAAIGENAIAVPGTPDDFRRLRWSAYKIAKCAAGLTRAGLLFSYLTAFIIDHCYRSARMIFFFQAGITIAVWVYVRAIQAAKNVSRS